MKPEKGLQGVTGVLTLLPVWIKGPCVIYSDRLFDIAPVYIFVQQKKGFLSVFEVL